MFFKSIIFLIDDNFLRTVSKSHLLVVLDHDELDLSLVTLFADGLAHKAKLLLNLVVV